MATNVWIVACLVQPNLTGTTLAQQCPVTSRVAIQTTQEFISQPVTPSPLSNVDPTSVAQVFSLGFSFVVLSFLVGRGVGVLLDLIRRG